MPQETKLDKKGFKKSLLASAELEEIKLTQGFIGMVINNCLLTSALHFSSIGLREYSAII